MAGILYKLQLMKNKELVFCWLPSHMGIQGNDAADAAAKEALNERITFYTLPSSDFRVHVNSLIRKKWQGYWDDQDVNKLNELKPYLGNSNIQFNTRRDEVVYTRLRLGHSYITHSFLLRGEEPPLCVGCNSRMSIKHILMDCVDFTHTRLQYYNVLNLKALFDTVSPSLVISFIKAVGLYKLI